MSTILYFFRDSITGVYYFIYVFVCLFLMFSIIGYLFKQKYAKVEIKLNTSQPKKTDDKQANLDIKKQENNKQINEIPVSVNQNAIDNNKIIPDLKIENSNQVTSEPIQEIVTESPNQVIQSNNIQTPEINSNQEIVDQIPEIK